MAAQHSDRVEADSCETDVNCGAAEIHPSVWGDFFLKYTFQSLKMDVATEDQVGKFKEEVKRMLVSSKKLSQALELIDLIQRLGVSYHFEEEIREILKEIKNIEITNEIQDCDLRFVSLRFRLLRQEGYNISSDIFKKFVDQKGKYKDEIGSHFRGILSLYEASHFMVHDEPLLEEALSFATFCLRALITNKPLNLSPFLEEQIKHALEQPIRKSLARMEAKHFISIYQSEPSHNELLLRFAKLDFNIAQKLHQKELGISTRWWRNLHIKSNLPYVRDRHVEMYFMVTEIYFEPKYALCRSILIKVVCMTSIIDDTFDSYGTIEDLEALTSAIQRWDRSCVDDLPNSMKYVYNILLDTYEEIEEMIMSNIGKESYRIQYAKNAMKKFAQSQFDEAKCFNSESVPTIEEYLQFATLSCGFFMVTISSFLGMEDHIATEEAFQWAFKFPKIIYATSIICRLLNDIVGHQENREVTSSVICYMKQFNVSKNEAFIVFHEHIKKAWKDINKEWLEARASSLPLCLLVRPLNLARGCYVLYKEADTYTNAQGLMKNLINYILVEPIPI